MFTADQYELLDVGDGRRLERFGPYVLDRPAPAARSLSRRELGLWSRADARFERHSASHGTWSYGSGMPASWEMRHGNMLLELKCTSSGAVGVFPEQAANWDWLQEQIRAARRPLRVLNLFAYTGASTLAAAAAGAEVVHVDAARSVVSWARRNAALSGLESAPVRWITDDARLFTARELRRGVRYDALILDPPSYGHGPKARSWKLEDDLPGLLDQLGGLLSDDPAFVLLTCHTPGVTETGLKQLVNGILQKQWQHNVTSATMYLATRANQRLASGLLTRWPKGSRSGARA